MLLQSFGCLSLYRILLLIQLERVRPHDIVIVIVLFDGAVTIASDPIAVPLVGDANDSWTDNPLPAPPFNAIAVLSNGSLTSRELR